jgi:hypothetical protein
MSCCIVLVSFRFRFGQHLRREGAAVARPTEDGVKQAVLTVQLSLCLIKLRYSSTHFQLWPYMETVDSSMSPGNRFPGLDAVDKKFPTLPRFQLGLLCSP